ncbi:MAG: HD domain-containing protein [Anaerolineae bacterium]|nr:HD domain-containing protein [Anaerolineae bacterium]
MPRILHVGAEIIPNIIKLDFLQEVSYLILTHHEKYDGTGYPMGLCGNEIPLGARIISVADAYIAMTEDNNFRQYRKTVDSLTAITELERSSEIYFDPAIVKVAIGVINENGSRYVS